jgi:hypothetical protein
MIRARRLKGKRVVIACAASGLDFTLQEQTRRPTYLKNADKTDRPAARGPCDEPRNQQQESC